MHFAFIPIVCGGGWLLWTLLAGGAGAAVGSGLSQNKSSRSEEDTRDLKREIQNLEDALRRLGNKIDDKR